MSDAEQRHAHLFISLGRGNDFLYLFRLLKVTSDFRVIKQEAHRQQRHVCLSATVGVQEYSIKICWTHIQISDFRKYILFVFCMNAHPHSRGHFKSVLCQQSELIILRCDVCKAQLI